MKYTIAFAAAFAAVQATNMVPVNYGGDYGYGSSSSSSDYAVSTTAAPSSAPAAHTSTAYVTDEITVISCGPEVTNCPGKSTVPAETPTAAPPAPPVVTSSVPAPPQETTPVATSVPSQAPPAPPASQAPPAPPAPPATPLISTQAITTCIPTTIYQTVTITETSSAVTTPVAISQPPYATGAIPYASGAASGTGVVPKPTGSPIVSSNGAADLSASFGGMALAAMAALLFA